MTGQAVGAAASLCKKYSVSPRGLGKGQMPELQQLLLKQDQYIPHVVNNDPNDLARRARVTASSEATLEFVESDGGEELTVPTAQVFPISGDRIDRVELLLESIRSSPTKVKIALRPAATIWDFTSEHDLASAEAEVAPGKRAWVGFDLNARVTPERLYWLYVEAIKGVNWMRFGDSGIYSHIALARGKDWWDFWRDVKFEPSRVPVGTMAAKRWDLLTGKYFGGRRWNYITMPGRPLARAFCLRLTPESKPYGPHNVISGVAHPEAWTNIWISDPRQALPQWLELELPEAVASTPFI